MRSVLLVLLYGLGAAGAVLALVWLLPLTAPFLIAFAVAAIMEPLVVKLHRRGVSRSCAAGVLTALLLGVLGATVTLAAGQTLRRLSALSERMPVLLAALSQTLDTLQQRMLGLLGTMPDGLAADLSTAMDALAEELYAIPVWLSEQVLGLVTAWAKRSPDLLLFTVTTAIGIYFFSAYYRDVMDFLKRQLPQPLGWKIQRAWGVLRRAAGGYLRVQAALSAITFAQLLLAFWLLGIPGAVAMAAITAVIDALPVLGAGTVLIPWGVWCLLSGNLPRALGLLAAWGVITSLRSAIQARLMGRQLGLHPLVSLVTLYVGWKLCGVAGMLLLPLAAVVICQLNDAGVIHFYRTGPDSPGNV